MTKYGVYNYAMATSDAGDAAMRACTKGTTAVIEALYTAAQMNPSNQDIDQLTLACYKRKGIVEQTMSIEQYRRRLDVAWAGTAVDTASRAFVDCNANPSMR